MHVYRFQCQKIASNEDDRASVSGLFNGFCQCSCELYQNKLLRLSVWSLQAPPVPEWVSSHNPKTSMLGYLVICNCFTCVLEYVVICLCVFAL